MKSIILILFCAGEKAGLFVGHTAVRLMMGMPLLILSSSIAIGDLIAFANEKVETI